ncbi:hypothetical protein Q787_09900 [Ornithobacterium rhinotracheale H06-030791]|nr:hypothetical protein Q785_10070 [Ornithobacterium rhinotracheale ORT-UMN 88]KGB66357.1 hypothetical protein Q787_09900 [Ornithobacterium rhinotracheale H06-030791]
MGYTLGLFWNFMAGNGWFKNICMLKIYILHLLMFIESKLKQ